MKKPKPVMVKWVDSTSRHGWMFREHTKANCDLIVETLGFLIDETEDSYLVALSVSEDEVDSPMQIPKVSVVECWELEIE